MEYLTIPYEKSFDRKGFDCGKPSLNDYLRFQISQDIKKKLAVCFILPGKDKNIQGYYTLSNASIPYEDVPENLRNKFPKSYDYIPATLLGRLAIDVKCKGQGFGSKLLIDALKRCWSVSERELGSVAAIVDPLDEDAENFYARFGFIKLPSSGKMFLDMKIIKSLNL